MPRRVGMRYCRCGTRLAADNPGDRCSACTRQDQEHLQHPPELPLEYWRTEQFADAFAAQHIGLLSVAYRRSPGHRHPITQEQLGNWLGISQAEVSRIESGPPLRDLDRLTHWVQTIKVPPQLLWFDLPGQQRADATGHGRPPAPRHPTASHEQPAATRGQPSGSDEHHNQKDHNGGVVTPDHLAALLDADGGFSVAGLLELAAGTGSLPATGLLPSGSSPPAGTAPPLLPPASLGPFPALSGGHSLGSGDGQCQVLARLGEVLLVAIGRRVFLVGGAGLVALPFADAESTRHGLLRAMVDDGRGTVEEWQAIVRDRWSPFNGSPAERFLRLTTDMASLRETFEQERSEPGQKELRKAGALLAALISPVAADLGDMPACRGWARTARQLADASGDLHTRLWVRGKEVVMGLYQQRPVSELLRLAEEAVAIGQAQGPPRTSAWPELMSATAQTLAVAGRRDEAKAALDQARDSLTAMSDNPGTESPVVFSEHNLCFTESYSYTYLDEYGRAEAAQDAALRLYPPRHQYGPALIELMRALCQVRMGDTTAGAAHARDTVSRLPQQQRVHTVIDLGRKVLDAVPAQERHGDEAVGLRELVAA